MGGRIELHLLFCLAACVTSMVHAQTSVQIEYDFSDRDIRLAGGDSNLDGRVEKRVNGIWGTVCHGSFGMNDAQVVCQMLSSDLSAIHIINDTTYGPGNGPIFYNHLDCTGSETSIDECSSITGEQCEHHQDVAVVCSICPRAANFYYGDFSSVDMTIRGQEYHGLCSNGTYTYNFTYLCLDNGTWIPTHNSCGPLNITSVRLVDGVGLYDGIVQVLVGDTWGAICGYSYWSTISLHRAPEYTLSKLICNEIGGTYITFSWEYRNNEVQMMDQTICSEPYESLADCKYDTVTTCYYHYYSACNVYPLNITGIRLSGGGYPQIGRIELQVQGQWGRICGDFFDINNAAVLCRMMGLNSSAFMRHDNFVQGSGPLLMNYVHCYGSEEHINNCSYSAPYINSCTSNNDIKCGVIDFRNGNIVLYNSSTNVLTVECQSGITIEYICLSNGTWMSNEECPPLLQDIRLVDGVGIYDGRVEVLYNGTWGTICYNNYRYQNTDVICRMLGAIPYSHSRHAGGTGRIHIENLNCVGQENDLSACEYDDRNECSHSNDLGVTCYLTNRPLNVTGIRLADGTKCGPPQEDGEITYSINGTIATVHCHFEYLPYDPVIECFDGNWSQIGVCDFYGPPLNISSVRLVDGDSVYEGRVEIEVDGTYGTICDSLFDLDDADVICKSYNQNYGAAYYFAGARHGEGTGPIHIDRLFCGETNTSLFQCPYHSVGFCDHSRDVSVVCNECGQPDIAFWGIGYFTYNGSALFADCSYYKTYVGELKMTCDHANGAWVTEGECQEYSRPLNIQDVRLSGGQSDMEGRVEIKSMDTWGTICKNGFGIKEADVICNMFGFPPAQAVYLNGEYSAGTGPIFVDDLSCGLSDTHINNCSYVTYDNCSHLQDVAVKCTVCDDFTPNNGSINGTQFVYGTVLEVSCNYGHFLVGDQYIHCQRNATWSSRPECPLIEIACVEGYNITGSSIIQCQENRRWSDDTICVIVDCGPLEAEHTYVDIENITTFGEAALVSCNTGYLPEGTTPVECLANGTWSEIPSCRRNNTVTTYGTVVLISCDEGLEVTGNSVIKCRADGTWSDNPVCDSSDCGPPSVANGHVTTSGNTTFGNNATIVCNEGYSLDGSGEILCTAYGWENVSCVLQDCGNLTIDNGKVLFDTGTKFGDSAEVHCFLGYDLNGDSKITCLDGSLWSDNPICDIKKCPVIELSTNGFIDEPYSTTFGSTVTFKCNVGFLLVCSNGYISFDKPHSNPTPPNTSGPNDSDDNGFSGVPIIAPFYAGINKQTSQSISYRTIDILNDFPFSEEQKSDLEMVKSIVMKSENLTSFEPKFLLIADWNKVSPLPIIFQSSSVASFQLAIVSDGLKTLSMFIYPKDLMNWTVQLNSVQNVNVWVGTHNADTKITRTNPFSFKPIALQMDKLSSTNNVSGLLLTKIGEWKSHDVMDCIHWYKQHNTNKNTYHEIMFVYLPECPCDLNLARFDPWYWRIGRKIRRFWWQSVDDFEGDVVCVDMWHRSIFDPYGKSCCYYRKSRRFVEGRPVAGGLYHYHPSLNASQHDKYDVEMKEKCCSSDFCELYYQLHPIGTCYTRSPYSQGNFWGDPHISTLDRMNYTFNGLGEYTLLLTESNNTWFTLQARTERAVKHDGNLSDATIFSAFAAKDHTNASLHVELNSAKQGLILYGDGLDFTRQFLSGEEYDSTTLSISNNNGSARVFFKNTGIMLDIGVGVEMLSLSTTVPSTYANITRGILGNFDGDPSNDLKFPNETILNSSSSEREIFFYGAVNERTTVFFYEDEKDHDNFHNSSYVPLFLDEVDNVTMALAVEACNGTLSTECIYDFALTLNPAIAADTVNRKQQFDQDQEEIDKVIPTIEGCNVVNVTVGENVTCTVNVDDNIDIQVLGNNTYNATFNRLSSTITYTHTGDISSPLSLCITNDPFKTL
ncbi:DMBT1-like protein [Mya arenaria]|uniref:DMBT1-like protein n=1 Tax=Mya arenaria TaxID=6604 RepID=A0ABY7FMW4_MYAAR|nr:DMBT1-like protein [Mya arenaria]